VYIELTESKCEGMVSSIYTPHSLTLDKIGYVFDGIISSVNEWGVYIELTESKCEGMVRYQTLDGKWSVNPKTYVAENEFGLKYRLGDPIKVVISSVSLEKKQIDFKIF
jgi:ribonuclease R